MKRNRNNITGWLALDKPSGISSARAVAIVRNIFNAKKAGHAGTLDPLASGLLPIALGEATKVVSFLTDSSKSYEFVLQFGADTQTGDREGEIIASNDIIPSENEIRNVLKEFIGTIWQTPPKFSAIKVLGRRAYKMAREGKNFTLAPRQIKINELDLINCPTQTSAKFKVCCQKGSYVRVLAEDIAHSLGAKGHVTQLRRTQNGCFCEKDFVSLDRLISLDKVEKITHYDNGCLAQPLASLLMPLEKVLEGLPKISLLANEAQSLRFGQSVITNQNYALAENELLLALEYGKPVALAVIKENTLKPKRVFNKQENDILCL